MYCAVRARRRIFFREDHIHIGVTVFVIVCDAVIVDKQTGAVDICGDVAPHHHIHPIDFRDAVFDVFGLVQRHILQHHPPHARIGEFLLHNIQRLRGWGGIRQVFGQVVVDADHWEAQQAQQHQYGKQLFDRPAVADNQIDRTMRLPLQINTIFLNNRRYVCFLIAFIV